jgi:hypothetical protein
LNAEKAVDDGDAGMRFLPRGSRRLWNSVAIDDPERHRKRTIARQAGRIGEAPLIGQQEWRVRSECAERLQNA